MGLPGRDDCANVEKRFIILVYKKFLNAGSFRIFCLSVLLELLHAGEIYMNFYLHDAQENHNAPYIIFKPQLWSLLSGFIANTHFALRVAMVQA